jgi:hypothetical protein
MKKISTSDKTFFGLVLILIIAKVIWASFQLDHPIVQQSINSWVAVVLAAALGFVALKLAQRTGFPDMWDEKISNQQRFVIPVLFGLGFAVIQIILVTLVLRLDIPMVKFPLSIPVYLFGGIILEIFYRLIPMVFLVWLISNLLLRKRWQEQVFWVVAILLCLVEPVMQAIGMYQMGIITDILLTAILFVFVFAGNLIPTYFFRKYGFLAAIVWRLTDYLIWHIIWPLF